MEMETELVDGRMKPTIASLKNIQKGQWIFTCSMKPLQFDSFDSEKNPKNWNRAAFTDEAWERFSKYDDFKTMEGSHHSVFNCHIKLVSEKYAKWFLDNKIDELWEKHKGKDKVWELYEADVRQRCQEDGIEFEGF